MEACPQKHKRTLDDYPDDDADITPLPAEGEPPKGPKSWRRNKNISRQPMLLEIPLTKREILRLRENMAKKSEEALDVEEQITKMVGPLRRKVKEIRREIRRIRGLVKAEKELRNVTAEVYYDTKANMAEIYHEGKLMKEMPIPEFKKLMEERVNATKAQREERGKDQPNLFEGKRPQRPTAAR
jgi:hypothetical protein